MKQQQIKNIHPPKNIESVGLLSRRSLAFAVIAAATAGIFTYLQHSRKLKHIHTYNDNNISCSSSLLAARHHKTRLNKSSNNQVSRFRRAFAHLDWLGVDLDHTLVRYKLREVLPLIYKCLAEHLMTLSTEEGHMLLPVNFNVENYPFDFAFCSRGLVFDTESGNILRLDSNGCVMNSRHGYIGTLVSSAKQLQAQFGENRIWSGAKELFQNWKPSNGIALQKINNFKCLMHYLLKPSFKFKASR